MATRYALLIAVATAVLVPMAGSAQTTDQPFAGMKVKPGQTVIVTTQTGSRITGQVASLTGTSLDLRVTRGASGPLITVTPSNAREIHRKGPIWDGAVKGAAIGGGLGALLSSNTDYVAQVTATGLWMGAAIGLGFDALFGPARIYRAPRRETALLAPIVGNRRAGARLSITF